MDELKKTAQSIVGVGTGLTPAGKIIGPVSKITKWVTIGLVILLLIIAIVLFATKSIGAGVWVAGASIAIGSFYWYLSRDLCAATGRMVGMGEFIEDAPIERIDELDNLDDLKPHEWEGFD